MTFSSSKSAHFVNCLIIESKNFFYKMSFYFYLIEKYVKIGPKTIFISSQIEFEERSFSFFPSILTLDIDSILGSFLTFEGPDGLFLGWGKDSKNILWSTHVVEQLSFSMFPPNLTFGFD